ncbi:MAG: hypothetical protein IIB30_05945 [Chloroflexi bacterium]|nr:hypothetical protein [Chloroflexota bacterium]
MTNQFMFILVFVLVLGIAVGGAFSGGVVFGKSQRGEATPTQESSLLHQQSESEFGRGGLTGVIDKVEGNIVSVTTPQGPLSAALVADTSLARFTAVTSADLKAGMQVTIVSQIGADRVVEARYILLNPDDAFEFLGWGFFSGIRQQPAGTSGGDAGSFGESGGEHSPFSGGGGNFFGGGGSFGQH